MKQIENIIIHCSESGFGDVELIRQWHVGERGWRDIGYNGVILNGKRRSKNETNKKEIGLFEVGRGLDLDKNIDSSERGAHALGYNKSSIGICLIGTNYFYAKQFQTALYLCGLFKKIVPDIEIIGHYEVTNKKTCPNFDMGLFRDLLSSGYFVLDEIKLVMQGSITDG